jgi:DNA-binding MarR family transcriptional regulator
VHEDDRHDTRTLARGPALPKILGLKDCVPSTLACVADDGIDDYGLPPDLALWDSVDHILADWAVERPDLDFAPIAVVTRLARVRTHFDAELRRVFARYGLTGPDFRVLVALRRAGPPFHLGQARLMADLALTSGTISVRLDSLARRGIITRVTDTDDKRAQLVGLTEKGLRLFDEIAPVHLANEDRLLSALTDEERQVLAELLRRLLLSFESGTVGVAQPLGMRLEPAHVARSRRLAVGLADTPGLLVAETIEGTPAANAGLARGDLIVGAGDSSVRSDAALARAIEQAGPGGCLSLAVLRGDEPVRLVLVIPSTVRAAPERSARQRRSAR